MVKNTSVSLTDNAYARKALDAIATIEREAQKKKLEQVDGLKEALKNIDQRMLELQHQREQVEAAIKAITGANSSAIKPAKKRGRINHKELQDRIVRWLSGHPGAAYTGIQLRKEFPELQGFSSVAAFLKQPIDEGMIVVDKSGGNRNTRYIVQAKAAQSA